METGIFGLPQSGKTTVFYALSRRSTAGPAGKETLRGVVKVPDLRLDRLAEALRPQKVVPAEVSFVDFTGPDLGWSRGEGFSPKLLAELHLQDVLVLVLRAFADPRIPHPEGSVDPVRDAALLDAEMAFADLALIERRLERLQKTVRSVKGQERIALEREETVLQRLKAALDEERPLRELPLSQEEQRLLSSFRLLTIKPVVALLNLDEGQWPERQPLEDALKERYRPPRAAVVSLCAQLERELAQLTDEEAAEMRVEYGLEAGAVQRVIHMCFSVAGLITFFTVASGELRAWMVPEGATAVQAAGKIHTDMERGFIRAEVIEWETLAQQGSWAEARRHGLVRTEGREYRVRDGDVLHILFNV